MVRRHLSLWSCKVQNNKSIPEVNNKTNLHFSILSAQSAHTISDNLSDYVQNDL